MAFFREYDCTTLKTGEDAIFQIDWEQIDMDRKTNPEEANFPSFNYTDWVRKFTDRKYSSKYTAAVLGNGLPDGLRGIANQLQDILKSWNGNDNYKDWVRKFTDRKYFSRKYTAAVLGNDLPDGLRGIANQFQNILKSWNGNDNYKDWVPKFTDRKYSSKYTAAVLVNDLPDGLRGIANQLQNILKSWNGNDNYCKSLFIVNSTNEYIDRIPIRIKVSSDLNHNIDVLRLDILKYQNSYPSQYDYIIASTLPDKIDKGTRDVTIAAAFFLKISQIALAQPVDDTSLYEWISEADFSLSDGNIFGISFNISRSRSYRRYDSMFEMSKTAFGNSLELHLNRISEPIENINQILDKIMQTEQKALYEDSTLRYQEKKNIVLDQIFRTQKKKIDQEMEMTELIAKVITKIDKMIKAGQKVSEAFIIDICNEIIGNVFGIIEASNSFVDKWNGLVGIIKELKAVYEAPNERCFADNESHACTDNHIGPERHKNKNTKLKSNERIPHVFDLAGEIRKLSKSLLEDVSHITPTLLQLGLQMLKRTSYLWMSDNDLNLSKIGEIEDYGLDFQCPLPSNRYMKRMSTFKTKNNAKGVIWNEETTVKPEQLVGAGFSFDGIQDHVRCTSCECTSDVSQWNRNDEEYAISIHKGLAKDCIFVKTYGGSCMPEYV